VPQVRARLLVAVVLLRVDVVRPLVRLVLLQVRAQVRARLSRRFQFL